MTSPKSFEGAWADPPALYRGAPFWSWNATLEPDRLRRAIRSMHEAGMGGFFMHSRYGLQTPYLSERWFECVSACLQQARELGMKAYLYDEDRFPSGAAGGAVTRDRVDYRVCGLVPLDEGEQPGELDTPVARFAVRFDDAGRLTTFHKAERAEAGERLIQFVARRAQPSPWFNDGAYLDTLNPEAVRAFLEVTYEPYARRYAEEFGDLVPAIFTDEPNCQGPVVDGLGVSWTNRLPDEFRRRRGFDVLEYLPELFWPLAWADFSPARHAFLRTVTELYVESFTAQIGAWCQEHNIALTGHILAEQSLASQIAAEGACMPHYPHMQWPGVDNLCDQARELITAKQCSSAADQAGRERVLSEMYGCTGWDWPLEGHKFVGDWQLACGVNFRCPHLTHYSLAGGAKRDYPASIFSHSPWWPYYRTVEDYFGRLCYMLTRGRAVRDVLVLHPVESAWGVWLSRGSGEPMEELEAGLTRLMYTLTGEHFDWDFGDESMLAERAKADGERLRVGEMTYRLVVVPPARTLRSSTADLLDRFLDGGGRVLFVGRAPDRVDGHPDERAAALVARAAACADDEAGIVGAVEGLVERRVSVTEAGREQRCVWTMLRRVGSADTDGLGAGQLLFLQSHDRAEARRLRVRVAGRRPAVLWDARSGARRRLKAEAGDGQVTFDLELPATGSALVSLGLRAGEAAAPARPVEVRTRHSVEGPYAIERTEPNTLPLDYCAFRVEDEPFSEEVPTLKADALIRARFGLGNRLGRGHQPWYLYTTGVVDTAPRGRCEFRRRFHVTDVPAACKLAIERSEDFDILVNGQPTGTPDGWWVDEDIRTIEVSSHLRQGDNEVLLRCTYRPDMELEDLYLVGEFGVAFRGPARRPGAATLVAPPQRLDLGDWVDQGLPFYGGAVRYRLGVKRPRRGRRLRLRLPQVRATAVAVHVGGAEAHQAARTFVLPWPPFEADLTDALGEGQTDVAVEVVGGRRNILGPLHTPWGHWTGPGHFDPDAKDWTDDYLLTAHGLLAAPVLEEVR